MLKMNTVTEIIMECLLFLQASIAPDVIIIVAAIMQRLDIP